MYFYDGNLLIAERSSYAMVIYMYDNMNSPVGFNVILFESPRKADADGRTYWYKKNLQGEIIGLYSATGQEVATYLYDPYGNIISRNYTPSEVGYADYNRLFYRGYYYDNDLGLYYLGSRYYDANIGRFISPDDIGYLGANGDLNAYNLYAYCSNNPVMYSDPTGTSIVGVLIFLGVMMIAGGVTGAVISEQNEYTGFETFQTVLLGAGLGLALGGAIVAIVGVFAGAIAGAGAEIFGITALQAFAVGSLAVDFTAFVIAPLFGLPMEGIEYENPSCNYGSINAFKQPVNIS